MCRQMGILLALTIVKFGAAVFCVTSAGLGKVAACRLANHYSEVALID